MSAKSANVDAVIPVRFPAPYLAEAIASLQSQDPAPHRIIIVVHGTDEEAVAHLAQSAPNIRVLTAPAVLPLAEVRNIGVHACCCEFVALLDSDDRARPTRLARQIASLVANPAAVLATSAVCLIDELGEPIGARFEYPADINLRRALITRNRVAQSAVMLRRAAFSGYRDLPLCEDYDLWLRMAADGEIAYEPRQLTEYRVHSQQLTSRRPVPYSAWNSLADARMQLARALRTPISAALARHLVWCCYQGLRTCRSAVQRWQRQVWSRT